MGNTINIKTPKKGATKPIFIGIQRRGTGYTEYVNVLEIVSLESILTGTRIHTTSKIEGNNIYFDIEIAPYLFFEQIERKLDSN